MLGGHGERSPQRSRLLPDRNRIFAGEETPTVPKLVEPTAAKPSGDGYSAPSRPGHRPGFYGDEIRDVMSFLVSATAFISCGYHAGSIPAIPIG